MSPKTGRPPKSDAKKINLHIRLNEEEDALIRACAERMGTTRTAMILTAVRQLQAELDKQK